jgi:hypothetical protein
MMNPAPVDASEVRAPLIIGVTGHRDLRPQDLEALSEQVRQVLLKLKSRYSSTPLVMLSALAEGADRLAAKVALEPGVAARLIAPLPMPRQAYEEDFKDGDSLAEFRDLLGKAERWFELPLPADTTEEGLSQPKQRDRQYEEVAKFIARESQILIALWDGVKTGLQGGTSQVVRFQTEGVPSEAGCELEPHEGFPVYHIITPRLKNPHLAGQALTRTKIYPDVFKGDYARAEEYYDGMFGNLDTFNRNVSQVDRELLDEVETSKRYLFPGLEEDQRPGGRHAATLNRYAFADALARRFQGQALRAQKVIHWAVLLAFLCFVFFAHFPDHSRFWLVSSFLFFALARWRYHTAKKTALEVKYQDYRTVAEGLRVKLFWALAGVEDDVSAHFLRKQRTELDWVRNGLRGWYLSNGSIPGAQGHRADTPDWQGVSLALAYWVDDQRKYDAGVETRNRDKTERFEYLVKLSLGAAVGLAALLTATLLSGLGSAVTENEWLLATWIIMVDALLASGALLHRYSETSAFSEHAKQYNQMEAIFGHASELVREAMKSGNYGNACECLSKLGKWVLAENGDWVLVHRERPLIELPHP